MELALRVTLACAIVPGGSVRLCCALILVIASVACARGPAFAPSSPDVQEVLREPNLGPVAELPSGVPPAAENPRIHEIVRAASAARVRRDVEALVGFGTRHTLSDTVSPTRGIGAARRWIHGEFGRISQACGGCLEVFYVDELVPADTSIRVRRDTRVVNVVAVQRGRLDPDRHLLMLAHYDSRATDVMNAAIDAPGANDNASGVAATLEAARLLSRYPLDGTVVYAALAGEEQDLIGGGILTRYARAQGWEVEGVLNNDIVGNTRGQSGVVDNGRVRIFAPGIPPSATRAQLTGYLARGGELDVPSRQLARYVDRIAETYFPNLDAQIIYRLDRYGRGGDHTPFFLAGHPAIRITEPNEDFTRQHQDVRVEGGIRYGDLPEGVDSEYLASIAALNAASLASLAWAPGRPDSVTVHGAVEPSTTVRWKHLDGPDLLGYRVYWRLPTESTWTRSRWVGNAASVTLANVSIDNYFFGVAAVDREGNESTVAFPGR